MYSNEQTLTSPWGSVELSVLQEYVKKGKLQIDLLALTFRSKTPQQIADKVIEMLAKVKEEEDRKESLVVQSGEGSAPAPAPILFQPKHALQEAFLQTTGALAALTEACLRASDHAVVLAELLVQEHTDIEIADLLHKEQNLSHVHRTTLERVVDSLLKNYIVIVRHEPGYRPEPNPTPDSGG